MEADSGLDDWVHKNVLKSRASQKSIRIYIGGLKKRLKSEIHDQET